jgi:hypothetical protein
LATLDSSILSSLIPSAALASFFCIILDYFLKSSSETPIISYSGSGPGTFSFFYIISSTTGMSSITKTSPSFYLNNISGLSPQFPFP